MDARAQRDPLKDQELHKRTSTENLTFAALFGEGAVGVLQVSKLAIDDIITNVDDLSVGEVELRMRAGSKGIERKDFRNT